MPFREFKDTSGTAWRAWEIRPEAIHPQTRGEDYLADCYVVGWVVFETVLGDEKRRLCPFPTGWAKSGVAKLRELLATAERVPPRKLVAERQDASAGSPTSEGVPESEDKPDITDLHVVRTFRYPGGRLWTVCVVDRPQDGGLPALRFMAGMRSIDLRPWPKDWADAPNGELVEMLRRASPRPRTAVPSPDTPLRRWDDKPKESRRA